MNSLNIISPYRHNDMWVFDDVQKGLDKEPFVTGTDTLIDHAVASIPNAADGFNMIFSDQAFRGHQYRLQHRREEYNGNWYYSDEFKAEGWLCPALFHYFKEAPQEIFVKVEPRRKTKVQQ
jgi:hypothetical protein